VCFSNELHTGTPALPGPVYLHIVDKKRSLCYLQVCCQVLGSLPGHSPAPTAGHATAGQAMLQLTGTVDSPEPLRPPAIPLQHAVVALATLRLLLV
jgi:hypothetical protein